MGTNTAHCVFSLQQVDELQDHAHRSLLHATLVWNVLDDYAGKDQILEELHELVGLMLDHAQGIEALIEKGCQAAKQKGVA